MGIGQPASSFHSSHRFTLVGHAENSETDFIHSACLPRRKTAAVALLQQASCNKGRCGEGMKDVNVFSAWPTSFLESAGMQHRREAPRLESVSRVAGPNPVINHYNKA